MILEFFLGVLAKTLTNDEEGVGNKYVKGNCSASALPGLGSFVH
jgi:hypothetical protein